MTEQRYKLTNPDMTTHGRFIWEIGVERVIDKPGTTLCTDQVFHFYDSPELAALLNPIHADIRKPRLFIVECDEVNHDGLKGGSKRMKLTKEITLPDISAKQRVAFAILCALSVYNAPEFRQWADNWLNGADRTAEAAWAAREAAWAAWAAQAA